MPADVITIQIESMFLLQSRAFLLVSGLHLLCASLWCPLRSGELNRFAFLENLNAHLSK